MATGETPVNANNMDSKITGELNLAAESQVYAAVTVINKFASGKFTQELAGVARTFDNAVNSPKQKQIEKNEVEEDFSDLDGALNDGAISATTPRASKTVIPPGARSSRQFQPNAGQDPRAGNFKTATINGSKTNTQKKDPYTSATVNNVTTGRIAKLPTPPVQDMDDDIPEGNTPTATKSTPLVQPKPGSNTVSDDAGNQSGVRRESLFAKRARLRREARKARADRIAKGNSSGTKSPIISGGGGSGNASFR